MISGIHFTSYFHCLSVFLKTSENVWNTLRVDAYFLKREKRISVFRTTRILVGEALLWLLASPGLRGSVIFAPFWGQVTKSFFFKLHDR